MSSESTVDYRDVPGFPGYRVGSDGTFWSSWKYPGRPGPWILTTEYVQRKVGRIGEKIDGEYRRRSVVLFDGKGGKRKTTMVSRLVLMAFVGPCPPGYQAAHNDGDPRNNHLENLRWATPKDNNADKIRHGTRQVGERCGKAKFTNEQVKIIQEEVKTLGTSYSTLARRYAVTKGTIYRLVRGKTYV